MTESPPHFRPAFRCLTPVTAAFVCGLFSALAHAAESGEEESDASKPRLSEVVVTASGFEQSLREAPASISVLTRETLEARQYRDLAEALVDVEGVDVRGGTGKTGGLNISIRGMPSDYTLILVDGRRQNVAGNVTPNGFDDALTSFIPPVSAIERIEVVRGPMSTLYGSDAMGGVVNIITRKVAKEWGATASVEAGVPQDSGEGRTGKVNLYASGPLREDVLGLAVRGNIVRRGESDRIWSAEQTNARDPAPAKSRQHTLGGKLTLTPNRDHDIWLDAETARTWYDNEDCRLGGRDFINCATGAASSSATGYLDALRFNRDQVAVGHASRFGVGAWESSLMYTVTETKGRTIPTASRPAGSPDVGGDRKLETTNLVLDSKFVAPIGEQHLGTVGMQWWDAKLEDGLLAENHEQKMWSLFAEDEWRFIESMALTFGGRYDHHDAFGGEFSPRAYLVWNANPNLTVKGGVSRGFRAPRLQQLIDGVSGITGQGTSISIGNPYLKPETSTSTELGVLYDNLRGSTGSITLFHNKVSDKISSGGDCAVNWISSCVANPAATYSINVDEGKTWGFELAGRIPLMDSLALNMNYTWTDSEIREDGVKNGKLSDTAKHVANAQLRWEATSNISVWLRGEYRGSSQRFSGDPSTFTGNTLLEYQALGDLKGYSLLHLGGAYRVNKRLTINANIYNLLDKNFAKYKVWINTAGDPVVGSQYFKTSSATKGTAAQGRTFWISANMDF